MRFHSHWKKTIISLQLFERVFMLTVQTSFRYFQSDFQRKRLWKKKQKQTKRILKKSELITSWKILVWRDVKIPVRTTTMASRLTGREKKDDNRFHSAPVQRNSKIPIRLTRLTSGDHKSFSLEDKTGIKRPLPRDSAKDRSSRIPVSVVKKKDSAEKTGIVDFFYNLNKNEDLDKNYIASTINCITLVLKKRIILRQVSLISQCPSRIWTVTRSKKCMD